MDQIVNSSQYEDINEYFTAAFEELTEFYEFNWIGARPELVIIKDENEYEDLLKQNNMRELFGATGWIGGQSIYILSQELYAKFMGHTSLYEKYRMLIKHELSHLFYQRLSGQNNLPDWLWEGCAIYLSGQLKFKSRPKVFKNFLRYHHQSSDGGVYDESGFVVAYLVERFGKHKLLSFIKKTGSSSTKESLSESFEEIYGFKLDYDAINDLYCVT